MTNQEALESKLLAALEDEAEEMGAEDWSGLRSRVKAQASAPPGHQYPGYVETEKPAEAGSGEN